MEEHCYKPHKHLDTFDLNFLNKASVILSNIFNKYKKPRSRNCSAQ